MTKKQIEVKTPHDIFLDDLYVYLKHSYPSIKGITREMLQLPPHAESAISSVHVDQNFDYADMNIEINVVVRPEV